jgi:hypothetical protein
VKRIVGVLAVLGFGGLCWYLLLEPDDGAARTPVNSPSTGDDYWTDERMREAGSAMPVWNPVPTILTFVGVFVLVLLVARLSSGRPGRAVQAAFAFGSACAAASVMPTWFVDDAPRDACVTGWPAVVVLAGFAAFGLGTAVYLGRRWWALVLAVPLVLGVVRFGFTCWTGTAIAVTGAVLGFATAGLLARQPAPTP